MKKLFTLLLIACSSLAGGLVANAQSFTVAHDTVSLVTTTSSIYTFPDSVFSLSTSPVNVQWKVLSTNFPADWISASGFCDPNACFNQIVLWPSGSTQDFLAGTSGDNFFLSIDFAATTSTGCYYITVRMNNVAIPADVKTETFIICKNPTFIRALRSSEEISIYPNPATNTLNVIYGAGSGVRELAIHNIIGRQLNSYRVTDDYSASLNIESIPPGLYSLRLLDANGYVLATRRFAKQ